MIQGGLAARKGDESNRHRPRYSTMVVTGRCYERVILVEVLQNAVPILPELK